MKNVVAMLNVLFDGVKLKRWNGIYKSEDFLETSKQGLNAGIAYIIAQMHEAKTGEKVNYTALIELSMCRMVYKTIFTDINPGISYRLLSGLKTEADEYAMKKVKELGFDDDFCNMFSKYLACKDNKTSLELQIFHAASKLATYWEFNQIKPGAGQNYLIVKMENEIKDRLECIKSIEAVKDFMLNDKLNNFVDLYANTAFLQRWAKYEICPKVSDLSHMYMTAVVSYLLMLKTDLSEKKCIEGFYAGLFHDAIEIITGDLPHPIKKNIPGLKSSLTEIEIKEYNNYIKPLLPHYLNKTIGKYVLTRSEEKIKRWVKVADNLCAYVEIVTSILTGTTQDYFVDNIERSWTNCRDFVLDGVAVKDVYEHFYNRYLDSIQN